jgi:hypothetical protein
LDRVCAKIRFFDAIDRGAGSVRNVGYLIIAFAGGFAFQIAWWRMRGPSISSVLWLFALSFVGVSLAGLRWNFLNVDMAEYAALALLYISTVLSYAILCSAVEVPSPTLSLVTYIADFGRQSGCPQDKLLQRFLSQGDAASRLKLMETGRLVQIADGRATLTNRGWFFARVFEFAARFFGLPKGG